MNAPSHKAITLDAVLQALVALVALVALARRLRLKSTRAGASGT